jgi:hypothetical protein
LIFQIAALVDVTRTRRRQLSARGTVSWINFVFGYLWVTHTAKETWKSAGSFIGEQVQSDVLTFLYNDNL